LIQQMFTVRKRSDSNKCLLCESAATAANVYCAKAQRQQQMFTVRKRSDSNKCFCTESEASGTEYFHLFRRPEECDFLFTPAESR